MKNRLFFCLLSCLFLAGTTSFTDINTTSFDNIVIADVHNGKTGQVIYSFSFPKKFIDNEGHLVLPIQLTLNVKQNKMPIFTIQSKNLQINLPDISGSYQMTISIGDFIVSKEINL